MIIDLFLDKDSISEALTQNKLAMIPVDTLRRLAFGLVARDGYEKGGYGYHNNNGTTYRQSQTLVDFIHILDAGERVWDEFLERAPDDKMRLINRYYNELEPSGDFADYQRRCKNAWQKESYTRDDLNMLLIACNAYFNWDKFERAKAEQERKRREKAEREAMIKNEWAGNVGDIITFQVREAHIATYIHPNTYYASEYPLWVIMTEDGHILSWGDTSREFEVKEGNWYSAKVKRQNEYRGQKQTQIWKIKEVQKPFGFFH